MPPKRKRSAAAAPAVDRPLNGVHETPILPNSAINPPPLKKRASRRGKVDTNPDHNADIVDGKFALRASPDADEKGEAFNAASLRPITPVPLPLPVAKTNGVVKKEADIEGMNGVEAPSKKQKKSPTKSSIAAKKGTDEIKAFRAEQAAKKAAEAKVKKEEDVDEWDKRLDPDGDEEGPAEAVDAVQAAAKRSPPVHSDYLPLPWKGRLGYACLNTYLRSSNPPIFTSRTCRIASILEHRHPLKDPSQPEHATKNRSDKSQPASIERGQRYVEELCLANIRDIPKMLLWNDKYGIKFMRLSSEMFPFASHAEYGYKLAPFASEALAEAGRVAGELGHRLSTHPGQFTQLGSPRAEVIANAVRDLEYHNEMLSLLKLPEQANRDAVMILHLGGTFGDKAATLDRFRQNYSDLSPPIKARIVLENDDVSWSVHDLLPLCEELNIPLCLDFHHHNIIFDPSQLREGTQDITTIFPRIKATWTRKGITQKMHYSEPCPEAITGTQRRKHNPRPAMLPPCPNDMDLMIEAKDKEQAVFDLMRHYKLPGWDTFNDVVPYERDDDNRPAPKKAKGKKKTKKQIESEIEEFGEEIKEVEDELAPIIPEEEIGMGGKENRVYWPLGMEEWLRPKKREIAGKKKGAGGDEEEMFQNPTPANFKARQEITKRNRKPLASEELEKMREAKNVEDIKRLLNEIKEKEAGVVDEDVAKEPSASKTKNGKGTTTPSMKATPKPKATPKARKAKSAPTPSVSNMEDEEDEDEELSLPEISEEEDYDEKPVLKRAVSSRQSGRAKAKPMSYAEDHDDEEI
ncbi:probable UV-endonuclease UVE-1 [Rhynchosporium graminicola]|uniref:Probable UV-endonuclease UVE-1 n=1 Tax=Rhynchosporium graminicola TaxID=2792576 RepID=A0A1E1JV17_9HELO|nr:probable UV-endonuclease UVE-1 [Rhynchosporium commune]